MDQKIIQSGYVIQLYQYARRYRYNNEGFLTLFDHAISRRKERHIEEYTLEKDFLTFGDFDLLQIIRVDSFRKYHDVSELAKDWFGKKQSVLLYDISTEDCPTRIYYNEQERVWKKTDDSGKEIKSKFFCVTMLSLTNEILAQTDNILELLHLLRCKILAIIDELNNYGICSIECEVFGTFNTSELGILWLSDQYVDVLQIADYIKHIKIIDVSNLQQQVKLCPAFFTSFSTISIKEETDSEGVLGNALVQIAVHDLMDDYAQIQKFAETVVGDKDKNECIRYSVGEYDLVMEVSAKRAIDLIKYNGILSLGMHDSTNKDIFVKRPRPFLRNNIKLMHSEGHTNALKNQLDEMHADGRLSINWKEPFRKNSIKFEWEELDESFDLPEGQNQSSRNADYFLSVRQKLKERVSSSTGAVDTLDLLYSDYHSTVSTVYSSMWVSDLHRQFKAVLHAIDLLITSNDLGWSWNEYRDLTNAFKQQIYHLTQANRMFFEVPSCHLRSTGQYDFLMHAYYGIVKKIVETIYLVQGKDKQSELIPLITVNTVPQVKTQLYFEIDNDGNRVINLDIPNSIIFNPQRGIWYLTHELFHYAVPWNREERNYYMAVFLLFLIFRKQFLYVFISLISTRIDGTVDHELKAVLKKLVGTNENKIDEGITAYFFKEFDVTLVNCIITYYEKDIQKFIWAKEDALSSQYQMAVYEFADGEHSKIFFEKLFEDLFNSSCNLFMALASGTNRKLQEKIDSRIKFCNRNSDYKQQFLQSEFIHRYFDSKLLHRHTTLAKIKWLAVREACSDIAMVSLNGLKIQDYMLFCIQAWTDESNDKSKVLEEIQLEEESQRLRYALVAEYFLSQSRDGWCDYKNSLHTTYGSNVKNEFCKQYTWFYAEQSIKHLPKEQKNAVVLKFEQLQRSAEKWLDFFTECLKTLQADFLVIFNDILLKILSDYDIDTRITLLQEQNTNICTNYAERLKNIQKDFEAHVYSSYSKLFLNIPVNYIKLYSADQILISKYDDIYKRERFVQDISVAHYFQKQSAFRELGELNQQVREETRNYSFIPTDKKRIDPEEAPADDEFIGIQAVIDDTRLRYEDNEAVWHFHVYSLTELMFYIRYCFDRLNETAQKDAYMAGQRKRSSIWFRGHSSEKYTHVPTVMRFFKEPQIMKYRTIRGFQQSNFEEFKFRADGAPEMPAGLRFTKSDYIAMMQHYGASTNFLDWTENAFTSLYLALKYYYSKDLRPGDDKYRNVTLSIFHPGIYNHIRRNSLEIIREKAESIICLSEPLKKILTPEHRFANLIPNLSTMANEEYFDMFLLGDLNAEKSLAKIDYNKIQNIGNNCDMRDLFMPMAILTSRLNPRIRTQCGCFIAYNLYTPPNKESTDSNSFFEYISLEEIQERKKDDGIFLYKITIDEECCLDIVKWLETMGVSRENIFPELSEKGYYFE